MEVDRGVLVLNREKNRLRLLEECSLAPPRDLEELRRAIQAGTGCRNAWVACISRTAWSETRSICRTRCRRAPRVAAPKTMWLQWVQRLPQVYREPFPDHHCCTPSSTVGTTLFKVFLKHTTKESTALTPSTMKNKRLACQIKVVAPTRYGLEDLSVLRAPRRKHQQRRPERLRHAKVFSSQVSLAWKPAGSTTLLSTAWWSATLISERICMPCRAVSRHDNFPRDSQEHDKGTDDIGSIHGDRFTSVKVLSLHWRMFLHAPSSALWMSSVSVQMLYTMSHAV